MQIKKRLRLNVALSLLTTMVIGLVLLLSVYRLKRADMSAKIAGEIIICTFERVTLRYDYINNRSERAKEQWFAKHEQIGKLLESALVYFPNPEDRENIARLIDDHRAIGRLFSAIVADRRERDSNSSAFPPEVEERLISQLNMKLYGEVVAGRQLMESSREARAAALDLVVGGVILSVLMLIAATIKSSWTLGRAITDRAGRLRDGASVIGGGNLDHRIDIKGDDEFAELAVAFNAMTAKLSGTYHNLENEVHERRRAEELLQKAHDELEQRVLERTAELRRLNRELRAISNCNQTLMRAEDEQTLLNAICRIVCDEAGYRMAWVGYAEYDDAKTLRPVVWAGFEDGYLAEAKITWADTERGRGPAGTAFQSGKSACIQDFTADPLAAPWRESALQRGYRSNIALPLKDEKEKPFGVLSIYSAEPNGFTPGEVRLLEELAGDLAFGIAVLRTRAERKLAEEAMKQAKESAESANKAKDQFLAVLSHELRTPLTPVLAAVSARQAQEELPEELRADMDLIRRNVEMEAKLIDDLLDVTKISRGKLELHPEIVDAHLLLQTALDICQKEIGAKYLDISLSLRADPHHVRADPTRLRQVFWNLLKNAVDFTPEGGRISLRTTNTDGRLKIEIKDTGVGIRAELLPKIFYAFEQGGQDQKVSTRFGGLGLGLNIAKTVVEMHHGTLTAFSEGECKGATFTVELPFVAPASEPPQPPPPSSSLAPTERPLKILLVDDHPDTLLTMSKLLRKWGCSIVTADCVQAALEQAARDSFDLLISDLGLPDGSGLDIMRELKHRYALRGIALSGYGTEEDIRQSLEAGFEEHLTKPVSFQDLRRAIGERAPEAA